MSGPVLSTKLYIPPIRPEAVRRQRLIRCLDKGLKGKLTLISASAGFGKTSMLSQWIESCRQSIAWISLDEEHRDPTSFLTYIIAAIQTVSADFGIDMQFVLQSPQPPSVEYVVVNLLNEMASISNPFVLVLDDYHMTDSEEIDKILKMIIENQPVSLHLIISTREDPHLPLSRLRASDLLNEVRASDLRFTGTEASDFLNKVMKLDLSSSDITALENRTEGWIAGLQLAAISMRGQSDSSRFIELFTGSHHFILDYLIEEVLNKQPESIQLFLIGTSILNRLSAPLCDYLLNDPLISGSEILKYLEQNNLFIIPLDEERCWYRYHHLFLELLRVRLQQSSFDSVKLHCRASQWFMENDLHIEAFHHSVAAGDIDRTIRILEGNGIPRHSRRNVSAILGWLQSLSEEVLNSRPLLWITYASVSVGTGRISGATEKLNKAETLLKNVALDDRIRDFHGRIAAMRAILAIPLYKGEEIYRQSLKALDNLSLANMSARTTSTWTMGQAYELMGKPDEAKQAYSNAIPMGHSSGNHLFAILAEASLGDLFEQDNDFNKAIVTYRHVQQQIGKQPLPVLCEVFLGLARIHYQRNQLEKARHYCDLAIDLSRKFEDIVDRFIITELFSARLYMTEGNNEKAWEIINEMQKTTRNENFRHRRPEVAVIKCLFKLKNREMREAARIAEEYNLPIIKSRVFLAERDSLSAQQTLKPLFIGRNDILRGTDYLEVMVLYAIALYLNEEREQAVQIVKEVLEITEPEGFIRLFVDEGTQMYDLLKHCTEKGELSGYIDELLSQFDTGGQLSEQLSIESLSKREIEVLELISQGLSNREICDCLFLALDTVKGHNRRIFGKLGVRNRTMAIAKARNLGIIS